ncbi:MORN repeat-containing protein [Ferruginibacter profundus]
MKKLLLSSLLIAVTALVFAQTTTGKITGLKDAWGEDITYIGEIKNKQPNGTGIAIYSNGNALRYAGNFVNGVYSGKGTIVFKEGAFLTGEWKNGKLNGKGANLSKTGNIYSGNFSDGKKEGKGVLIYKDNALLQGEWKADKFNGRCIFIPGNAGTVNDNIYAEDKKNGLGYQYELDSKKLFQGKWKDGTWETATTGNYKSFLTSDDFYAEKTAKQILIGALNKASKSLYDTGFVYDYGTKKRYFGFYKEGIFQNGIIMQDDSSRFIGSLTKQGVNGYAYYYRTGDFYDEGNYLNDFLNGPGCLSINLKTKSIYYGETADKGLFTGKAWFANGKNELYVGDYLKGRFTGKGYRINSAGYCVRGTWNDGYPVTVTGITDDKGVSISVMPKTLADAIALVARQSATDLDVLMGQEIDNFSEDTTEALKNKSIISFPAALKQDYIIDDEDFYLSYVAPYLITRDFAKAKAKYNELCKQLAAIKITLNSTDGAFTLTGTPTEPDADNTTNACVFLFPAKKEISKGYAASVVMVKDDSGNYTVEIVLGDENAKVVSGDDF